MKKIFISYSHKDEKWKDRLLKHLKRPDMEVICRLWDDTQIPPGHDWEKEIKSVLNEADVAILIVSPDFLSSEFILDHEVPLILGRRQMGKLEVIPLIVKSCAWENVSWLSQMQVVPKDGVPLVKFSNDQIEEELAALAETIKSILSPGVTPPPEEEPGPRILSLNDLKDPEQYIKMIKSVYLFLRVDQLTNKLKSKKRYDDYLWGWSVCDPRRKKKVAKSQSEEPRAASIAVSSLIVSAFSSALDMPGIGISSDDITTGLVNSLKLRYCGLRYNKGVFGTPRKILREAGVEIERVEPNCRHVASALSILLRIIRNKVRSPMSTRPRSDDFSLIFSALRYIKDLEEFTLFSQDPELLLGFPDCSTCAIVLEFLDFLESIKDLIPYNSNNPFASPDDIKEWATEKIQLGLHLLRQLKIKVEDRDYWFWDYSIDKERFRGHRHWNGIPPLINAYVNIQLFHTCRLLYLLRNPLSKPYYKNDLMHAVESLVEIINENDGALPISYPPGESDISHITNTAFFLNSLIPDDLSALDHRFDNLLILGINKISEMFNKEASKHLKSGSIDLFADGMAMILRLSSYLPLYSSNSEFVKEIKALNESGKRIQTYIYNNQMDMIKEELARIELQGCFPIIKARVVDSRNWWLETYGST